MPSESTIPSVGYIRVETEGECTGSTIRQKTSNSAKKIVRVNKSKPCMKPVLAETARVVKAINASVSGLGKANITSSSPAELLRSLKTRGKLITPIHKLSTLMNEEKVPRTSSKIKIVSSKETLVRRAL